MPRVVSPLMPRLATLTPEKLAAEVVTPALGDGVAEEDEGFRSCWTRLDQAVRFWVQRFLNQS